MYRSPIFIKNGSIIRIMASNHLNASIFPVVSVPTQLNRQNGVEFSRTFSLESSVKNIIETQAGIFKSLSESTPVWYSQKFLVNVSEITGLPWWANVILCTVILRSFVTLPFTIYHHYIMSKLENLKQEIPAIAEELKKETAVAIRMFQWDEKTARYHYRKSLKKQWNNMIVRENCHPFKGTLLLFVQIPMWVSFSIAFRNLVYMLPNQDTDAKVIFYKMATGGFGWITNLTEPDPFILPMILAIVNLSIIEIQLMSRKNIQTEKRQQILTNIFRILILIMIPISASVPSCLVLYWTTSSIYGLIQNLCLMSPRLRRVCRIPKTQNEIAQPYAHIMTLLKHKTSNITK